MKFFNVASEASTQVPKNYHCENTAASVNESAAFESHCRGAQKPYGILRAKKTAISSKRKGLSLKHTPYMA
jgi:hypothetical protein